MPHQLLADLAGVTHLDVTDFTSAKADDVRRTLADTKVEISSLGYYPNPLAPNSEESELAVAHLRKVIQAAALLGLKTVTTFIGRDWTKSVDDNWPRLLEVWKPLVKFAEGHGVRIGIENCPMLFSRDEWPGGSGVFHNTFFSGPNSTGMFVAVDTPRPFGPRKRFQSASLARTTTLDASAARANTPAAATDTRAPRADIVFVITSASLSARSSPPSAPAPS